MSTASQTDSDNIFVTPSPGLYLVGEFRGLETISSRDGKQHHFIKVLTDTSLVQAYLPVENLLEWAQKSEGEQVIVGVGANVRKNKLTGAAQDEVQYGVTRPAKK